ncbi:L-threonylcarbamoyladenylate synthase [endosymbiont GvMRE of Glomus versiforme]|uniref:L-threonylcarbamoyladenylate synthase n=1 Tax=endosymbiont GvMRE of Glomus versiforme TaxID=2039283 RepID=UPI000EC868C5|nr:L-threonylcarbamoyladenylate synthase [endosymbiont GvMRE of Glomus versiforme]RHZ37137.1 Threonylcarbamoyl-AMP synthase [endosymbiont GvMRE of Glomus versiforme]
MTCSVIIQKNEIAKIIYLLQKGEILVLPTDTVYGLALSLKKSEKANLIYQIKQRNEEKPLAVVVSDLKMAKTLGKFDQNALFLLEKHPAGKITLIVPKNSHLSYLQKLENIGIRITADEWLKKIINSVGPLLMTSWNISGHPPFTSPLEGKINNLIGGIVDGGILTNKPSLVFDNIRKKWVRSN